jgi:hypothetical protein
MAVDLEASLKRVEKLKDLLAIPPGKKVSLDKDYDPGLMPSRYRKKEMKVLLEERGAYGRVPGSALCAE